MKASMRFFDIVGLPCRYCRVAMFSNCIRRSAVLMDLMVPPTRFAVGGEAQLGV